MDTFKLLSWLSNMCGVSGDESAAANEISGYINSKFGVECKISNGNVIAEFGKREKGRKHILIDAHLDEIGMVTTYIDEDGFIVPSNIGGMDYRLLPAQKVTVHGIKDIPGVISTVPPHLSNEKNIMTDMEQVRIDTGYSREELEKLVPAGSTISFDVQASGLLNGKFTGKALDNRAGVAAVLIAAELLENDKSYNCSYSLVFSSAEEIGERGAATACYEVNPDIALVVDASFAIAKGENENKCGKMGNGPMIGISPSLSREISDMLISVANKNDIPYQLEVMSGTTGTDADRISICRAGVRTCTCSFPLKHMHTPAEVVQISDIEKTAALIAAFVREVK